MASGNRLVAACALALLSAPGTWFRTTLDGGLPQDIDFVAVQPAGVTEAAGWQVAGVWEYRSEGQKFGGFSALLPLGAGGLRAFSDRGYRITLTTPDQPEPSQGMNRQQVSRGREYDLTDAEAATRDPASGAYWVAYEQVHAIQRSTIASHPDAVRDLEDIVDWPSNAGIEAMVRLADGRFVILPEGGKRGLMFRRDPVEGDAPEAFRFVSPAAGYKATDLAQLPDGRLMVLMRRVVMPSRSAWPPFSTLLALGPPPQPGGTFAPQITLRLDSAIPRENYEGLAVREGADGRVEVWLIADDNFSAFQRTLLAKLLFNPQA
jgi:hypothetical protein